jgi:hypothetical protein
MLPAPLLSHTVIYIESRRPTEVEQQTVAVLSMLETDSCLTAALRAINHKLRHKRSWMTL